MAINLTVPQPIPAPTIPPQRGIKILRVGHSEAPSAERIIIYGRAGIGKTRLALSLTPRFGKIAYYAADNNSEYLTSISPEKHNRIILAVPQGDDPILAFTKFCMHDWKSTDPEIKTLIVDTYTKVAMDAIRHSANSGSITNEKHYVVGDPKNGGQTIPNRGDYLAIENLSKGFLDLLFTHQRDMNIIFLCHEDIKLVEGAEAVGGPAHPGRSMTEYLPAQFSTVIRLIRDKILLPKHSVPTDVVIAIADNDGKFIAKVRTQDETHPNPLGRVILDRDPSPYWEFYDKVNHVNKETTNG